MKKSYSIVAALILLAMVLSLLPACGESATPTPTTKPAGQATAAPAAATPTKVATAATSAPAGTAATTTAAVKGDSTGVTDKEILIGASYPLTGALSAFASLPKSIDAYFKYVNETKGGVNGRKLTLKVLDDGYQAAKAVLAMKQLVEEDKVFLILDTFGTAPALGVRDYLNEKKVPQLFVFSGAATFGADYQKYPWTIGWQPNYEDEAAIYAKWLLQTKPNAKVGVLYQNDDYGKDELRGFEKGLGNKAATMIVSKQSYESTSADATSQLASIKSAGADTIFWAASNKWVAQGLKSNYGIGYKPLNIVAVPAASVEVMQQAGLDAADGVISSAYIKDPTDPAWKSDAGMVQYTDIMKKYYAGGAKDEDILSRTNFAGFALSWNLEKVLEQAGKDLTRESLMKALGNMNYPDTPFAIPGIAVKTDVAKGDWRPMDQLQLTKFDKAMGTVVRFGDIISPQ